jgi:hypothetical protein
MAREIPAHPGSILLIIILNLKVRSHFIKSFCGDVHHTFQTCVVLKLFEEDGGGCTIPNLRDKEYHCRVSIDPDGLRGFAV